MTAKHNSNPGDHQFIADGCERAQVAIAPEIRAEVDLEFAERLQSASFLKRWLIRREMAAEVERRIQAQAPSDALY